ncbi:MAG: FAD-dependent oxidoreductase [Acidimicrobiia bacterium]|nr:FAD-dependent oxidoreductase [Acidimicrobiia bacterium]
MERFDVVVLGTGAAGLTAALAAHGHGAERVGLFEKHGLVGGTSAMSGGMVWIPCSDQMEAQGIPDSREDALAYLGSMSHDMILDELAEAYVDGGPAMLRWLEDQTSVVFEIVDDFPDYHPEQPGGKPGGGRSLECPLFAFGELGEWANRITTSRQMSKHIVMNETTLGRGVVGGVPHDEMARRAENDLRGCGQALVGRLLRSCLDRGIEPRTGHRAVELLVEEGQVAGVRFETDDGVVDVEAPGGVILATGGFEWNRDLVRSFIRGPLTRTVAVETNTGDGLTMAMRIGAALGNMQEAWWVPIIDVVDPDGETFCWMVNRERVLPRSIMVNRAGRRFANEAANYNAFGAAFHQLDPGTFDYTNIPAWMICDHDYFRAGPIYTYRGEPDVPGWIESAPTLRELASRLGIDGEQLERTVERWNAQAAELDDSDWDRGKSVNDTHWGDGTRTASATIGPLETPPYYAVEVHPGALGTKGGPRTTGDGQVIDLDGNPIAGLYAAGNVMASAMGMTYGGAGGTLGPGMVFGFLGGRHAARVATGGTVDGDE